MDLLKKTMIYISLTTVPKRLNNWHIAERNLRSLLTQRVLDLGKTKQEQKVVLNIPMVYKATGEEFLVPEELYGLQEEYHKKLIINRDDIDYGPILKVVGAFRYATEPDDIIIAVDDDHVYHEKMAWYHVSYNEWRKKHLYDTTGILGEENVVQCFRGDMPTERRAWQEGEVTKYMRKPTHLYFPVLQERELLIPGHWHSVMYKRGMFGEDFMELLDKGNNDDMLVGYYMKKKGITIKCIPYNQEDDGRPVNDNGKPCFSFPIIENLPVEDSGFNEFRKKHGDGYGWTDDELMNFIHNHDTIFTA